MQLNFNNQKDKLTENDIDQIVSIVCNRCRVKTYTRVRSILTYNPSYVPVYGILERLMKDGDQWSYCAGQSYPDEIRTIREIILNGK